MQQQKKLMKIGHSVALVIDKPLRDALGIKPTTLVHVMSDGKRLIVEPCGERSLEPQRATAISEIARARAIAERLMVTYHVGNDRFSQLTAGWNRPNMRLRIMHYGMWLGRVEWAQLTAAERRVVRRFDVLYSALRRGAGWDEALAAALEAEPFDPADPAERSVG